MNVPKEMNKKFLKRILKMLLVLHEASVYISLLLLCLMLTRLMIMANIYPHVSDIYVHYQMR